MRTIKQTAAQKAASRQFSDTIRGQANAGKLSVPITREGEPHRHKASGRFIAAADISDYFRQALMAKSRPSLSPDNGPDDVQETDDGTN